MVNTLYSARAPMDNAPALHAVHFIGKPSLQSDILSQFISDQLKLPCRLQEPHSAISSYNGLMLLDCKSISAEEAPALLEKLHQQKPYPPVALINTQPGGAHEKLIHWPAIKGIFNDNCSQEQLVKGLNAIVHGDTWLPRRLLNQVLEKQRSRMPLTQPPKVKLTRREREILGLTATAATNTQIAKQLNISEHTVKSHMYNIFKKIHVRNRMEAINWAKAYLQDFDI